MREQRQLTSRMGMALVVTALVGASAFADSRPSNETRERRDGRGVIRRGSSGERSTAARGDNSSNASRRRGAAIDRRSERGDSTPRTDARVEVRGDRLPRVEQRDRTSRRTDRSVERRSSRDRLNDGSRDRSSRDSRKRGSYDRGRENNRSGRERTWRGDSRSSSHGRSSHYRQPHYSRGRVSRVHRYGHGYRVWIHGTPYPYFIPLSHYHRDRFRVGLFINLGGYYNPRGYYDYYDGRSSGAIRGIVESVDHRRDSFVIRNEATGSFVTVLARDRRLDVRAGDYVEISGDWTRAGVFQAFDVDLLDDRYIR